MLAAADGGESATGPPNALRHTFSSHSKTCTGVAFSPVNNLLLCSAGLDGRIYFYDIAECKEVKKIDAQTPLSAISFCADGHTIGVGTLAGNVLIYDLKNSKQIKIQLKGHDSSQKITCLRFSRHNKSSSS